MRRELNYEITEDHDGESVADFLRGKGYSHRLITDLKHHENGLSVGGSEVYAIHQLSAGDVLKVSLPEETTDEWIVPIGMPLDIVYEDEDLIVINKDTGVTVHPTRLHQDDTLANGLRWYYDQKGEPFTMRVVNRLDRDTTGLLIVARHALSACVLGKAITERRIHRVYIAAAMGDMHDIFPSGEGLIDAPIACVPDQAMLREINRETGEEARTHVKILCYNPELDTTLCEVTLETGRTHQIRVHFQYTGHPLPGDFLYNPDYSLISRQALHSYRLSFEQPVTGEELSFTAPLPEDMKIFLPGRS